MTKFTKTILTFGLLIGIGVGGKYGYDYMKDHGYFDDVVKTNVSAETVAEINDFLNDDYNIGFIQVNYEKMDLKDIKFDTIAYLLNNPYEKGSDGKLIKHEFISSPVYKDYVLSYETNLLKTRVCYDAAKINEYVYSITNQYLNVLNDQEQICNSNTSAYIYMTDVSVEVVVAKDNIYSVTYKMSDAENIIYNQRYNYTDIETRKYSGKVVLEKIDNKYIFKSNEVQGARNLYNF